MEPKIKRETEHKDLENSPPAQMKIKACSRENTSVGPNDILIRR